MQMLIRKYGEYLLPHTKQVSTGTWVQCLQFPTIHAADIHEISQYSL